MESHDFLKEKYGLHQFPEVEEQAKRTEKRTGEKVPPTPEARIQNYLNRFKEIVERKDPQARERGIEALKIILYRKNVIKSEDIPESYFETQRRLAREAGHGEIEITPEAREQLTEVIIADQKSSLDTWIDYLSSPDATYPDWLKYWTTRSILTMGEYDKENKQFTRRSKGTVKPFPDLNREALAYVLDVVEKKYQGKKIDLESLETEDKAQFEKLLKAENFAKLYAWAIEKVTPASPESLTGTKGQWIKYNQDSDHMPLVQSLQGHGTGWCTAGESTAAAQLQGGDFYVFYSLDTQGKPTIPRAAIRMEQDKIAEVRGIAQQQNLDPYIGEVVKEKMKEFPDGPKYEKKASDMKLLTTIENKVKQGQKLTKSDLAFLYELNSPIEGFGYQKDPRIAELLDQRSPLEDMPVLFECQPEQIAGSIEKINENTKAYVGPLVPGIFDKIQERDIEHVYTSFPEGKIRKETIKIGGKDVKTLIKEMQEKKINISDYAMDMLKSKDFTVLKESESEILIRLKVGDLGFPKGKNPTTDEIYRRIEELGLELCPPETGPAYRLKYSNQPMGDWFRIGMKQISDRGGNPRVFSLERSGVGLWLSSRWAKPSGEWGPGYGFVFRLRKLKPSKT